MHPGVYIVLGIFVLIVVLGFIWQRKIDTSKENVYIDFAHKYDLEILTADLRDHFMHLTGEIDGLKFELKEEKSGSSQDSATWTYVRFLDCPIDFDFQISCENMLMQIFEKLTDYEDVNIGNEELDKKYVFHSKDAKKMERFLNTFDEMKLLDLYDDIFGMIENKTESRTFQYVHQGKFQFKNHMESLEKIISFMRQLLKKSRS